MPIHDDELRKKAVLNFGVQADYIGKIFDVDMEDAMKKVLAMVSDDGNVTMPAFEELKKMMFYDPYGTVAEDKVIEYLPCPFCGNHDDPVGEGWCPTSGPNAGKPTGYYLMCGGCGMEQGLSRDRDGDPVGDYDSREEALKFWNTRNMGEPCEL